MEAKGFMTLTKMAKNDNRKLLELIEKLQPLINSYVKKLFFLDKDDAKQEIILSIIESVKTIPSCENDYKCLAYIHNAVKYKYANLCKKNIKKDSFEEKYPESILEKLVGKEKYTDIEAYVEIEKVFNNLSPKNKLLLKYIILGYSDTEIANIMGCSRQYINRIKKKLIIHT